jgi:hypothetical protein
VWLIIAIILPLTYTAIIKPMICTSVCDFSLFLHNCTFLQMWIYMNCAILLFLSPSSSTGVGEGKWGCSSAVETGRVMLQVQFQCHYTDVLIILVVRGAGGMYLISVKFLPTSAITQPRNKVYLCQWNDTARLTFLELLSVTGHC